MSYIDLIIPLIGGIIFTFFPDTLIKTKDDTFEKKKSLLKKCGYLLLAVSILYLFIILFS
jgi:hypothetical protein